MDDFNTETKHVYLIPSTYTVYHKWDLFPSYFFPLEQTLFILQDTFLATDILNKFSSPILPKSKVSPPTKLLNHYWIFVFYSSLWI